MNFTVSSIPSYQTHDWLLHKHYAKRIPSISFSFGLYDQQNMLQGVVTFGKPASNALCIGVCGEENSSFVYELNRLCVNEGLKRNVLSFFLSKALKMLPPLIIVSYADTSQNHHGYIYQATNWTYTGLSAKRTERFDPKNPNKHSKSVTENKKNKYQELSVRERPQKHRYLYFTGNRTQNKHWKKALKYKPELYPKGNNQRYEAEYKPTIQTKLF